MTLTITLAITSLTTLKYTNSHISTISKIPVANRELKKETAVAIVLIVAQRIGSIMEADKIIVLDEGKVVGCGKHKELLKSCSVYKEIALSQLTEEELA